MTFVHSKQSRLLVNERHLSGQITSWTAGGTKNLSETTTLLDEGTRFVAGLVEGTLSINGLFDSAAGSLHDTMSTAFKAGDGDLLVTAAPAGLTVGMPAICAVAHTTSFATESPVADAVSLSIEGQPDDGVDFGVLLHGHTAETATGTGTDVDLGAATGKGVAFLHVTNVAGTTPSLTCKVQHSADSNTWVDLLTFTAATAATRARKVASGPVSRHVRATWTISGTTPSFTFALAYAPR